MAAMKSLILVALVALAVHQGKLGCFPSSVQKEVAYALNPCVNCGPRYKVDVSLQRAKYWAPFAMTFATLSIVSLQTANAILFLFETILLLTLEKAARSRSEAMALCLLTLKGWCICLFFLVFVI